MKHKRLFVAQVVRVQADVAHDTHDFEPRFAARASEVGAADDAGYRRRAPIGDPRPASCENSRANASLTMTVRAPGLRSPPWNARPATIGRSNASKNPGPTADVENPPLYAGAAPIDGPDLSRSVLSTLTLARGRRR